MKRLMSLLLAVVLLLSCIPAPVFANAAEGDQVLYLKPNANWLEANARFAIYYWDGSGSAWTDMADADGDGYYEGAVPAGFSNIIFCRMNPGATDNSWDNKWNQTSDLTVPTDGTNCYTVAEGTWDQGGGAWSVFTPEAEKEEPTEPVETTAPVETEPVEATYYVAGTISPDGWASNGANSVMTLNADGLYEKTFENVAAGSYEFKVTDGTWDNCWPGSNFTFATTEEKDVTILFNADTKEIQVLLDGEALEEETPVEASYYVAGTVELCGEEWACGAEANKMTLDTDGLYKKTFENVPAGEHQFKITDGTWDNCWPGSNYVFTTTAEKHITITFNASTKEIGVIQADPIVEDLYTVAGTGDLCGTEWDPANLDNKLSLQEDGLYGKTYFSVPAGTHLFKVTDGTWDNSWGQDGGWDNYKFSLDTESNVTIIFNPETKEITVSTMAVLPYYVAGSDGLCGVGWDPGYAGNKMFLDLDGLYKKVFQNVAAGTHECKVTDGTWNNSWGLDGQNYVFTTDEAYDVTIIFNPETLEVMHELSEPTVPALPPEPVVYDITIKVHYYRPDAAYGDWEVHMWNGAAGVSATREFELEDVTYEDTTYGATATYYADAADTWVGFIIKKPDWTKDPDGDRKIDISNVLSGTVHVYAKTGSSLNDFAVDKSEAVLGAKITAAVYDSLADTLTVTTSMPVEDPATAFILEGPDGEMTITKVTQVGTSSDYIVEYEGEINADEIFTVYYNGAPCVVTVPNTYSTETFEAEYTYTGDDLGATWTEEGTTFRLWAPTASKVLVNLYTAGNDGEKLGEHEMTKDVNGTWIVTVEGDLNGVYYTYSVTRKGETVEACDPYARTTGVNGNRAMVIDLDSTDPTGWENDTYVTQKNYTDAVIWELHVRDFSIDVSSGVSEANRGKYLAFTELGTTVPGTEIATGVDYMVDLGINYVHLLPVYDINSVDETVGGYNWGYDPKNYNVPEGSYSTDPYNGAVRVNEFKQMVQSLHNNGIGVIMDVVYNHVADAEGFCFNQIVPGYFSRIHDDGSYQSNSGCGNDTASERAMVRKYIVDSVVYWAEEYHIDGFRWDLVGLIDYETINEVMAEVHKINPNIIFYGEGWEMCSWTTKDEGEHASDPYSKKMTIQPNDHLVNTEAGVFAFFNDTIRNVIHGGVFTATDKGFVVGGLSADTKQTVIDGYMGYSKWGSNGQRVDTPLQTINYASCHDNYTLFDNFTVDAMDLTGKTAEQVKEQAARYNHMAAAYYITAQGVPFIHAGEEMLRSKPDSAQENGFNHNSYASGDEINSFKWYTLTRPEVDVMVKYYQGLIAFRKAHPALRMTDQAEILTSLEVLDTGSNDVIAILNKGGNGEDVQILTIINTGDTAKVTLPEGKWNAYVCGSRAGTEVLIENLEGWANMAGCDTWILVKAEEEVAGGSCGENLTWTLVDGVLTVSGEGAMTDETPWMDQDSDLVKKVVIEEGVTSVGDWAFAHFYNLTSVMLPESIVRIGEGAFYFCTALESIVIPEDVQTIEGPAFTDCHALTTVIFEGDAPKIDDHVFWHVTATAYYPVDNDTWTEAVRQNYYGNITWVAVADELEVEASNVASTGKIKLTWDAIYGASSYDVYRSTSKNGTYTRLKTVTGTSLTNTSISAGETYYYYVVAVSEDGQELDKSDIVKRTCDLARPVVTLSNIASNGKIRISWDAVEGAVKYQLYWSADGENWDLLKTTTGTGVTNTKAEAGKLYYYKVRAIAATAAANSAYSTVKSRYCDLARPVVSLSNVASTGKVKITWKAVTGAVEYDVYVSTDGESWKLLKTTTGTRLTHTSAAAGTKYYYKVKAIASSSASNSAFSEVKARFCNLARPTLTVSLNSKDKPSLTWNKVAGAVKYQVYISTDGEDWNLLKTVSGTKLTHSSAEAGTKYFYKVRAIAENTAANSAYSTAKSVTVK